MSLILSLLFSLSARAQAFEAPKMKVLGLTNYIFEVKNLGGASKHNFIFENTGILPITNIQIIPVAAPFYVTDFTEPTMTTCDSTLPAGGRCTVTVVFKPTDSNSAASLLVLSYFDGAGSQSAYASMAGNVGTAVD